EEPFPGGTLPAPSESLLAADTGGLFQTMPVGCRMTANILQIIYFVPAACADVIGNAAPWYFTMATVTLTASMFVLNHGIPQLTNDQWQGVFASMALTTIVIPLIEVELRALYEQLKTLMNALSGDPNDYIFTAYGVLHFGFNVCSWIFTKTAPLVGF